MHVWNQTGFPHAFTMAMDKAAREHVLLVVKGTFDFPEENGAPVARSQSQVPLVMADAFTGAPGFSATLWESDFAFRKPRCDVVLNGAAYAPNRRPADRVRVGLKLGAWSKVFDVVGHREWRARGPLFAATAPEPFLRRPFSYDVAWGGTDRLDPDDTLPGAYLRNPVGTGWARPRNQRLVPGLALPATQAVGEDVASPFGDYTPMSFGPVGRGWPGRIEHGGTYDQAWIDTVFPFLPADFDDRYYQMAPPDQQIPFPKGGEEVVLRNLTPDGTRAFRLPALELPAVFGRRRKDDVPVPATVDAVLFEPEQGRLSVTWRASLPIERDIFEVVEAIVGHRSKAFWKARRLGKTYYRTLADLPRGEAA
jgi:hypothetical protein